MTTDDNDRSKGSEVAINESGASCSFCGKSEPEVKKIIAVGANQKPICNECIVTCKQILKDTL